MEQQHQSQSSSINATAAATDGGNVVVETVPLRDDGNNDNDDAAAIYGYGQNDNDDVGDKDVSKSKQQPTQHGRTSARANRNGQRRLSVTDLIDPTKPWMLVDGTDMLGFFDFVPKHLRVGPWDTIASIGLFVILYSLAIVLVGANILQQNQHEGGGDDASSPLSIFHDFQLPIEAYQPYTASWWYHMSGFVWCTYILYLVASDAYLGPFAFVSYTLWSWTIITIRHGLCAIAPFVVPTTTFGIAAEMLRLPVLMSSSVTFGVWNFILMPAICLVFIQDTDRRWKFLQFAFGFRLFNLHVLNIVFAVLNASYAEPRRQLHLCDLNALALYMTLYLLFYYFVLDRFGMHLYPIFSPRVRWVIISWLMVVALCIGGYHFWKNRMDDSPY